MTIFSELTWMMDGKKLRKVSTEQESHFYLRLKIHKSWDIIHGKGKITCFNILIIKV